MNKKYFNDPFLKILPVLDLHGETSDTIVWLIKDFLNINHKMGKDKVVIIHGISGGTIKRATHDYLRKDKLVDRFYVYNYNVGVTIVELKRK